jgi:hypothetical protein
MCSQYQVSTVAGVEDRAEMLQATAVLSGTELVSGHTIPPGISDGYTDQSRNSPYPPRHCLRRVLEHHITRRNTGYERNQLGGEL